jgi:hypothetical protein
LIAAPNNFNQESTMKIATGVRSTFKCTAAAGFLALAAAGAANAGCMMSAPHQSGTKLQDPSKFNPAAFHITSAAGSLLKTDYVTAEYDEGLVGLWQFELNSYPGPDWGTQAFHSDGTELMFSGGQDPETGDVCQGVWRQVGRNTYTLNHIAMGWNAPGGSFGLRVHIHEVIKLDPSGTTFTGTYSLTGYCESKAIPPFPIPAGVTCDTPSPFFEYDPREPVSASNPNNVAIPTGTGTLSGTRVIPD